MTNAEVTAYNRPTCKPSKHIYAQATQKTRKDERGVQVLVVLLDESSVVFFCFMAVHPVELGPGVDNKSCP